MSWVLWEEQGLAVAVGPARLIALGLGLMIVALLYRRVTTLGRLTVVLWIGLLATVGWILVEGAIRFRPEVAFDFSGAAATPPDLFWQLGPAMMLAIYSYLGYYNVCYVGEEVREPARVMPRAILYSAGIVIVLFIGLHLAMLGTVSWKDVPTNSNDFVLPAEFMRQAR